MLEAKMIVSVTMEKICFEKAQDKDLRLFWFNELNFYSAPLCNEI